MSRRRKRIEKLRSRPSRMLFSVVERILLDFGFRGRSATGSHVWFSKPGVGNIAIPRQGGRFAKRIYLEQVCALLDLDRLDLDRLDELLGADAEVDAED